ncbi:glycogen operon protein [Stackebrandtia albiflava]|uniref:Glycogen operon protein n=1 Tax=Stackebrandtia albiflava TaxID=406432 RepID=A0A562UQA2_9ACTN|nr:isoamylase [Stackebrandtia albiflava]TWJ07786.1 glycogen operon protein [Stackebrandtia albiflava]
MSPRLPRRAAVAACALLLVTAFLFTGSAGHAASSVPLGGHYTAAGDAVTFAVYSSAAERIDVYLYSDPTGAAHRLGRTLTDTGDVFTATLTTAELAAAGITRTVYYGYRAWGPNWRHDPQWTPGSAAGFVSDVDAAGNRFNPNKLLSDPYSRELSHDPLRPGMTDQTVYASGPLHRLKDSGLVAPKSIVLPVSTADTGVKPTRPLKDDVVYEVHVRGFTADDPAVPAQYRGTYRGAGMKAGHLAALGVTAVELLPVAETPNDANDVDATGTEGDNYWGYATLNYFAPDRRYSSDKSPGGPTAEFQAMVKSFHDNGIKVFVDVVYNHTGEGYAWRAGDASTYNILSWRGLDNPTYYSLTADRQHSFDNTGVGGNYNTYHPVARDLIVESLRHWRDTLGVDGFRLDLASVLGNTCQHGCFRFDRDDPATALNAITAALPPRPTGGGTGTDWIAEPWAIGPGTYQVGNFPAEWSEWNDTFRDTFRADQNKLGVTAVTPGQLATRIAGSSDLYGDDGRTPAASVNFIVAHDGFTLSDLYSCNAKHNTQPWPYGPSDGGSDHNLSWDQGGDPAAQRQAARNGMALTALSAGTPMFNGGDEHLRSLRCNNNPYNLDSSANWLDWSPDTDQTEFAEFTAGMLAFRADHPALRPGGFYTSTDGNGNGMGQLDWFTPAGVTPDAAYWNDPGNHALGWRLDGTELGDPAAALYVAYNGWSGQVGFTLPDPGAGRQWYRVTDTAAWAEGGDQVAAPGTEDLIGGAGTGYDVHGRSLVLLIAK